MSKNTILFLVTLLILVVVIIFVMVPGTKNVPLLHNQHPRYRLIPAEKIYFNSFVDCNMAEAWIGDTFRIFPGKYGEDPLWGNARDLKFANGTNADVAFNSKPGEFFEPLMPPNTPPGKPGLHGAVWFETMYQSGDDPTGRTLFAVYHNENYPSTLPFDPLTGYGYIDASWPQGLKGPSSPAAVCKIGIMKSTDGGRSWTDKGIFIEDFQPRMILKPHNTSNTFAGGVGDPSAVASNGYLYLFYGEYGYSGIYNPVNYSDSIEWSGQCISVARISLNDLEAPEGKASRWDGKGFNAAYDGIGSPISSLQIPRSEGGGPASSPRGRFHWGPSVSWNSCLESWVMLMALVEGPSWQGGNIYISFNKNADLGKGMNSQEWTKPELLVSKPGHIIWYPSLQPTSSEKDIAEKNTCLKLGQDARLYYKDIFGDSSRYFSEYIIRFEK
jgi:hypothetical protein